MEIWWNAGNWRQQKLHPVCVVEQTARTITICGIGGGTVSKRSEWNNYFATFNEAKAWAIEQAKKKRARAETAMKEAEAFENLAANQNEASVLALFQKEIATWASRQHRPT